MILSFITVCSFITEEELQAAVPEISDWMTEEEMPEITMAGEAEASALIDILPEDDILISVADDMPEIVTSAPALESIPEEIGEEEAEKGRRKEEKCGFTF